MIWIQAIMLLAMLGICSLSPGFLVIRRWRLSPTEKLCISVGLSLVLVYLASFLIYILKLPTASFYGVSITSLGLLVVTGRDLWRLLTHRQVRRLLGTFGLVLGWGLLLL